MRRRHKIHYGRRFGVSAWFPSEQLRDAAEERTEGMVGYFQSMDHSNWLKYDEDLRRLARSCYLQGAIDAANQAAQMLKDGRLKP